MSLRIAVFLVALIPFAPLYAHDVWLEADGKTYTLVYGHPGELEAYDPAKTRAVTGIDKGGKQHKVGTHVHGSKMILQPSTDLVVITVDFDNGFWTKGGDDVSVNKSKREVPGYQTAIHSKKFNKTLVGWSEAAGKPVGAEFEIVPLVNPLSLKPGDSLPVQLLYKSKPLADAEIEIHGVQDLFLTDSAGKTALPIEHDGFQYIQASYRIALENHPDADTLALSTNLTFDL